MCEVLNVHAYDWIVKDRAGDDDQTIIDCWALDVESVPCLLRIIDFPVFCMIELPSVIRQKEHKWTLAQSKNVMIAINKLLGHNASIKSEFFYCQKLYYYQGSRKSPFIRAYFKNVKEMNGCKYKLENAIFTEDWGCIKCTVYENQISVVRKLLTLRNVRYSKWFEVIGVKVQDELKISTLENEYIINWQSMTPIPDDICGNWITNPGTLSWDIECYSDNHLAMPDKYNDAHVAYMVSAIYKKYKINSTIKRYGILIGDCHHIPEEKLSNCEIIRVNSEYEMVQAFAKVIKETDPEILVGYNILSFDYPYLDHRILRDCKPWPHMSRLIGEVPIMNSTNWKSSAYGSNSINNLKISGRISIDLLPIVRRDYKFESYTLNFVCKNFLKKQKNDVSPIEMFEIYEEMQAAIKNYNAFPDEINALHLDKAKKRTTVVMEYCIKDSELVLELMENLDVWIGLIELSNIVGVTIVEIFTKGQQVRCVSQLYDLASRKNIVINIREETTFRFAGGSVQKPIPGLYENVICLDFKSLYPSIIQAMNICYTTLIHKDHMAYIPDEDCHIIEFEQEEEETVYNYPKKIDQDVEVDIDDESSEDENEEKVAEKVMIKKHYKFKYYKHKEGLLPLLVKTLVAERNAVRRLQKNEKNPGVWMVLEKRQLALKTSSNSFFGFLGVREGGKMPCMEAAMSITAKGRSLIKEVETYLHEKYGSKIVYGDSVTHDTPILCKQNNIIQYLTIDQMGNNWIIYGDKESSICNYEAWTEKGWTKIHKVIRHYTNKDIYHIETESGSVDVTSDHSLLDEYAEKIKPVDVTIGTVLLHADLPKEQLTLSNNENVKEAEKNYHNNDNGNKIIKITNLGSTHEYVYDLETENHHFSAGIGRIIVHNTDSVMVDLKITDSKQCQYWGEKLSQEISGVKKGMLLPGFSHLSKEEIQPHHLHTEDIKGLFLSPLEMEFEKAMRLFCIKPKKYAAYLVDDDGEFMHKHSKDEQGNDIDELDMLIRGIVLARRDNNMFLRVLYKNILNIIMSKGKFKDAILLLIDTILDLLADKIHPKDLKSTRELGAHYKQPSFFMKVFADELRKKNKIVNPGDRLEFVVIENKEATLAGQRMVLMSDYIDSLKTDTPYKLDYIHYIEKVLVNPIDQLFEIGFTDYLNKLSYINYKPANKRQPITLKNPTEMMYFMIKNNCDIKEFRKALIFHIDRIDNPNLSKFELNIKV